MALGPHYEVYFVDKLIQAMEEVGGSLEPDDLMDIDDGEGSDLEDEEEELIDDPIPSPLQLPSSGAASTATSTASSPPNNDDLPPIQYPFSGKPLGIGVKRGRGRPRREGGKPVPRKLGLGVKLKRWKSTGFMRGLPKRVKGFDRTDFEFMSVMSSPIEDSGPILDPETGTFIVPEREKSLPSTPDDTPYPPEQWPGKVCAFCNLGERSQLGQREMLRLTCPEGFIPQKMISHPILAHSSADQLPERDAGDKSPRGPVTCRRQKSFNKCRHPSLTSEYIDELTIIGHIEEPDLQSIFDLSGHFYVHRNCATWSNGVLRCENLALQNVGPVVLRSTSKKCSYCNHYGASLVCKAEGCNKLYHFPCATASGAFQELKTLSTFCAQHLAQVPLICESAICYTCKLHGDIANLMFCSSCGEHYHGTCVGLAQLPGVRAGWQCRKCRICQVCRIVGDESKLMACEQCDKVYHASCQRPIVTTIPKYGWKCKCCRVCGDCGSRTPGAGLSSRWHAHYTVCDSCYQQRNKGFSCPLCHRAYRAHAHREMVQCALCRKFVHGTCDPEADLSIYQQRKDSHPDYEYVCLICKTLTHQNRQLMFKRNSIDESDSLPGPQESFLEENYDFEPERQSFDDPIRSIGLGKGKPYSASKIAKKRLGIGTSVIGRPKGVGKGPPGKVGFMKRQRLSEFGRKRGPKSKMRGVFGVPGVGLQRPTSDGSKNDEEPGIENRLVLCSAKDKFVLTQDICVMCGSLGTDQEGCLIACVQCGQCYHPYCVNVKVTKVILQKGWRCLDCTVCEGCGQRNDESRLILCDECDISYHIYCMDPPLDYVPHGNWKCKWCAICQICGASDPGFNCSWMNSFIECGPCASHTACPSCLEPYNEGDLIIQCVQCERWLHGTCDSIKTEIEAERCAEEGYTCLLCRPRDVPPPHMQPSSSPKPPTPSKSPEVKTSNTRDFYLDGVHLSESGYGLIKSLTHEQNTTRKKRKKIMAVQQDKDAGIMATIESVVAGSSMAGNSLLDESKIDLVDIKEEPQDIYKEGMIWTKEDGPPPEGFTLYTMENGGSVLRRKRQRNLQKLGIGGFLVRVRGIRGVQDNDDVDMLPGQTSGLEPPSQSLNEVDKPRRKPARRKPKSKLAETFPSYLQEAFFGKELLESTKELDSTSDSDEDTSKRQNEKDRTIQLSQDEIKAVAAVTAKSDRIKEFSIKDPSTSVTKSSACIIPKEEDESDTEAFKDVLALPGDLLDTDLVNTIMNEDDEELTKNTDTLETLADSNLPDDSDITDPLGNTNNAKDTKDELTDILGSHFNIESIPNINSKDVEDIFKNVLTDESQESQESTVFPIATTNTFTSTSSQPTMHPIPAPIRPTTLPAVNQNTLNSPASFPPQSPYHSEYSNSPQFSPAFSEPPSPWITVNESSELDTPSTVVPSTYNQRSSEKMKADEGLGSGATISAVLYANMNHPEWKTDYPIWNDRYKQIIKKWRTLSTEQKAPYLQQARDNRSALRMKKQQQINKESVTSPPVPKTTVTTVSSTPSPQASIMAPVSEVCTHQLKPSPSLTSASSSVSVSPPISVHPISLPPSPPTQQQFTVRGQFMGPDDHCGSAPNVTVNPLYQHNTEHDLTPSPRPCAPPAADQQIRVLTPSEIMRTLPSLSQENYEPQPLDQEKVTQQQKSAKEAEQERQWKQLQAMRQQQAQQQQHVLHEQRTQAIANVQRSLSDGAQPFVAEQVGVLQVTSQQISSASTPSPATTFSQLYSLNVKGTQISSPSSNTPPTEMKVSQPVNVSVSLPSTSNLQHLSDSNNLQPKILTEPITHIPPTPKIQFTTPRPALQGFTQPVRPGEGHEVNRQLRDLLQRQQFKKLDEQLLPGKGQQRVWPPSDTQSQESEQTVTAVTTGDATFRHPLPPGIARPRAAVSSSGIVLRQPGSLLGLRLHGADVRMQGVDFRMRLLLQQQQQRGLSTNPQAQFQPGLAARFPALTTNRPINIEQYEQLLQKQAQLQSTRQSDLTATVTQTAVSQRLTVTQQSTTSSTDNPPHDQEIPDNVTAELEKLEQETGTMVELQGVGEILGGLGEDDDELLAEMGADFNILEYADPELDTLTSGGKTNILDSLDLVEPEPDKDDKKAVKASGLSKTSVSQVHPVKKIVKSEPSIISTPGSTLPGKIVRQTLPPPLAVTQQQTTNTQTQPITHQLTPQQQVHQQMLQQVQQAAAMGRPMAPGTKLMSPDGVMGVVTPNNNVSLTFPANYAQRILNSHIQCKLLHIKVSDGILKGYIQTVQNQKLQMRGTAGQGPRLLSVPSGGSGSGTIQNAILGGYTAPRMNVAPPPPPPPPPYPGPPPPYPGSTNTNQQMGLQMGTARLPPGLVHSVPLQGIPLHLQRRPLLLQEQPLLLEDLLEQEKREQEKQLQTQTVTAANQEISSATNTPSLLSDHDFERLKADVFNSNTGVLSAPTSHNPTSQSLLSPTALSGNQGRSSFPTQAANINQWQQNPVRPAPVATPQPTLETSQIPTFNVTLLAAPPLPPENIVTEQDRQAQLVYEQWLNNQNSILSQQLKYYETEVQKLRKIRKSLNSKQRQLRKSGNQLAETDAMELQRISAEQAILQKHLESSRKQSRQHGMLIQEYRNKQQAKQRGSCSNQQIQSPLGPPNSSPIHHTPQSSMMSPSASPMMVQHGSPLQSPRPVVSHSPGPGSVSSVIHSPSNPSSNMSPMQPSPRIGTPHSQSEGSPGPVQSPSQVCLPPPAPRMTSPQHRRIVTSPVTYSPELRPGIQQSRFIRPTADQSQRPKLTISNASFLQRPASLSPLNSPPPQQMHLTQQQHQQLLQRQLQQQAFLQQNSDGGQQQTDINIVSPSQRAMQLIQQRQLILRQQQLIQQQQQQQLIAAQPQSLTPQQHQMMVQQQQQLAKQQQQQIAQIQQAQGQSRITSQSQLNQPPSSPMPPRSPMIGQGQQIMSPHSVHSQPASPMVSLNTPTSPIARSPALHQNMSQPPNSPLLHQQSQVSSPLPRSPILGPIQSPMSIRRPPSTSSSPVMLDCPLSVENPTTPRTSFTPPTYLEHDHTGGGNPHNIHNPIPIELPFGRFGYFKLGLRGGSPMWSMGRGAKRIPTSVENKEEKPSTSDIALSSPKIKKELHLNKVSILKKKLPTKSNLRSLAVSKVGSLVSSDYNEFDDSSCTPPVTPPPIASTSKGLTVHKVIGKRLPEHLESKEQIVVIDSSPDEKQIPVDDVVDYDDDNDSAVVSTEISLNSVAQQPDSDDITVIETFSQNDDLTDVMSSPLESSQIGDEFLLFPGNMVVDIASSGHFSDKEDDEEEYGGQIVNVAIQSPTPSEEELIMQGRTKQVTSDGLTLNIVQGLSSNQLLTVTDTPDSPEPEDMSVETISPDHYSHQTDDDILAHLEDSEIVIIDPSIKSPEIATTEDFEKLIDEDTRKEKILKSDVVNSTHHISEIHKYAANILNCSSKSGVSSPVNIQPLNLSVSTATQIHNFVSKSNSTGGTSTISFIPTTNMPISCKANAIKHASEVVITRTAKLTNTTASNLTSIILPIKTTVSPAITIVSGTSSRFTIPVISASAISKLPNVKVIDKPSSSLSLTAHDTCLPKKIFDDESSVSPDSSTCEDEKSKFDTSEEKYKEDFLEEESLGVNITKSECKSEAIKLQKQSQTSKENTSPSKSVNKFETLQATNVAKEHVTRIQTPVFTKSPSIGQSTPELKMTAQVIQEKQGSLQITSVNRDSIAASFITSQDTNDCNNDSDNDTKSVVISIPSPTPSQEQLLDNMALQALENRRRDGKGIPGEFDTFEDVLDMIENITGEPPALLEANIKDKIKAEDVNHIMDSVSDVITNLETKDSLSENKNGKNLDDCFETSEVQTPVTVSTSGRPTIMPQLSPLSQPTDLTTNMANVSQQLRTLLSSLHTTTVTTSSNVATIVKSVTHKEKVTPNVSVCSTASAIISRIIQPTGKLSPILPNSSNVVLSNMKSKPVLTPISTVSKPIHVTSSISIVATSTLTSCNNSVSKILPVNSVSVQLTPDYSNFSPASNTALLTQNNSVCTSTIQNQSSVISSVSQSMNISASQLPKKSLSLNAMLQSHPAATVPQTAPGTITTASILGSPITIAKSSSFSPSLVHAQPIVVSPLITTTVSSTSFTSVPHTSTMNSNINRPAVTTSTLLHSQLTKTSFMVSKSEEPNLDIVKKEDVEPITDFHQSVHNSNLAVLHKQESISGGCKFSTIQGPTRVEDSQNVLLKQLLQNTACATTSQTQITNTTTTTVTVTTPPTLPTVPNLEAQLARPVPPTPTSLLPPLLQNDSSVNNQVGKSPTQQRIIVSRETSFVSKPVSQLSLTTASSTIQQLHIDIKKCLPPSRTPSRDELLSPPTPRSTCSQDSSLQTPPLNIKKENQLAPPLPSPLLTPQEVKKEFVDESSQHSEVSDQSRPDVHVKEEIDLLDNVEKSLLEQKEELKKIKRRAYQQKRRQNQILNKEAIGQPKKRPRKSSKVEEDYDSYIDGMLAQLRTLSPMVVQEPQLGKNFGVVPIFGSGDLNKLGSKDYDSRHGDLSGEYGNAVVPGYSDFYSTKPYGDIESLPEKPPASTQRGFYDQEFPLIKFDADEDRKFELFCRDNDTPDSVISSSSPECPFMEPYEKFIGLKLIDEDEDDEEVDITKARLSPVVPIIAPIPIRLKPVGPYLKDYRDMDKENVCKDYIVKSKFGSNPATPLKDSGNVTVTLTLTSSAAEDIMGVLRDLANLLHIPPPTSYQIVERTSTPPSQKLGLYRTKGKDGKEGVPIDIQSILNGAAKFCRHCDVVILNNMIRKKVSELPFLSKDSELLGEDDELYFCSTSCYMQFAIMHRSPSISEDKAAAIIDHLCQKDKYEIQRKALTFQQPERLYTGNSYSKLADTLEKMGIEIKKEAITEPMDIGHIKSEGFLRNAEFDFKTCRLSKFENIQHITSSIWKGLKYKYWSLGCLQPATKFKKPTDKDIIELLYRLGITLTPPKMPEDTRKCMFCQNISDGVADGPARLLNFDVDKWVHLNCGLWSDGVYETVNGALMNLENAIQQSLVTTCIQCNRLGATIRCFKTRCTNIYHLPCAVKDGCVFYKNKTIYCPSHILKNEKDNELTTLSVCRRVYVNRDENRQVAAIMHHASDTNNLLRVGSLIFLSVGQLLPHQLQNFHTSNYIYPIGYKIVRFYWSMRRLNKRCRYVCSIHELSGRPEFRVLVQDPPEEDIEYRDSSPKGAWSRILESLAMLRRENHCLQVFPRYITGEDLFGLTEPTVVRVLESLPGIETLTDYKFKYGRNPLLELPLAINPSGAARTEPKLRNHLNWKRPHTQRTGSSVRPAFVPQTTAIGEVVCPYSKQFVHSKSSQYKKMKQEWRNNVYLARSKIQGLGLYAARDLEKHTMVIEYIGEIIRTELAETREKKYEAKNRGIYMFRLDEERVIDATLSGGLARYINHSCNPNCVAEIVEVDRDLRIIIFAKRRIQRGEELAYDYKFDIEDDQHKISCMCGAPNCRKWMN